MVDNDFEVEADRVVGNERAINKALNKRTGQNKIMALGAAAVAVGIAATNPAVQNAGAEVVDKITTGADKITTGLDHTKNAVDATISAPGNIIERLDGTENQKQPQEILLGNLIVQPDVKIRTAPNLSGEILNDVKLIHKELVGGKIVETYVDPKSGSFKIQNGLVAIGQNPDGGMNRDGAQYAIVDTIDSDGNRGTGFINFGSQSASGVVENQGESKEIRYDSLPNGGNVIVPVEPNVHLPQAKDIGNVTPATNQTR